MKAKKYKDGGKSKGMNTAQRKERYMKDLKRKQEAEQKEISGKNFTWLMSGNYGKKDLDERLRIADEATKRLANNREATVYKPQREMASAKFDKNTKYDDLLGRSTNPDKKYKKGGKVFKPHNMYKNGKAVMAKTMADHLRLKKQGYTHKK